MLPTYISVSPDDLTWALKTIDYDGSGTADYQHVLDVVSQHRRYLQEESLLPSFINRSNWCSKITTSDKLGDVIGSNAIDASILKAGVADLRNVDSVTLENIFNDFRRSCIASQGGQRNRPPLDASYRALSHQIQKLGWHRWLPCVA